MSNEAFQVDVFDTRGRRERHIVSTEKDVWYIVDGLDTGDVYRVYRNGFDVTLQFYTQRKKVGNE
jgi:hypothetical protein